MARDLTKIIDLMIAEIPAGNDDFISNLKSNRTSVEYSSPETMGLRWETVAETLMDFIGIDENSFTDWQKRIINIWMDKEIFELNV